MSEQHLRVQVLDGLLFCLFNPTDDRTLKFEDIFCSAFYGQPLGTLIKTVLMFGSVWCAPGVPLANNPGLLSYMSRIANCLVHISFREIRFDGRLSVFCVTYLANS